MRLAALALAGLLGTGCVTAYVAPGEVIVGIVGSPSVSVCEKAPDAMLAEARPCVKIHGAAISSQGANVITTVGKIAWEILTLFF